MDPDANLKEQLEIAKEIKNTWDDCNADGLLTWKQEEYVAELANRLSELVLSLNEWIVKGGLPPKHLV